ncbi:Mechanosensitive ion channel [Nakamurella panacisegetis]|uniref:Mechanosensitive ion channel n=1 Tax=Nakamurella panacisegetis TaxID=1090615 RepID=A0A1H0MFE8_9ACTN|nr:Mechanosensitive ion channel [Nakamurella panacisegetis]
MLKAIDRNARPDLKKAVPAVLITMIAFVVGERLGGLGRTTAAVFTFFGHRVDVEPGYLTVIVVALAVVFVLAGALATRSVARELARVTTNKAGLAAASAIRLIITIVGYLTVALGLLGLLNIDLGNLLVGGAVTGVVIGIAAQQTLGNFFAGLVLLFARPYVPGTRVKVRTGALGGPFEGVIVAAGLLYTTIETDDEGPISMPNSGLLAAAIGPAPERKPDEQDGRPEEEEQAADEAGRRAPAVGGPPRLGELSPDV